MIIRTIVGVGRFTHRHCGLIWKLALAFLALVILAIVYQYRDAWHPDTDPDRGAIGIDKGALGESYSKPTYLEQGWKPEDSLWFYNTTQGSDLIPYDFFVSLEQADSQEPLRSPQNIDKYRYLPQKATDSNPDALPVGFVKDQYQGKHYVGYTCAACHTGQVNYKGQAIRIDGGPAMADMVSFLKALEFSMKTTLVDPQKLARFKTAVVARDGDYAKGDDQKIEADLKQWANTIALYNSINYSHLNYGNARLDAFGRIYNRVLEHVINKDQLRYALMTMTHPKKGEDGVVEERILSEEQVNNILKDGVNDVIIGDKGFSLVMERLTKALKCEEGKICKDLVRARKAIFNEPDAPVSYPFLWDVPYSDYVQWNGLAANADIGPMGRNTGEVIGVFGTLDWQEYQPWYRKLGLEVPWFRLTSWITGESRKKHEIQFNSSIDLTNLQRIESSLKTLKSPEWPEKILGTIDRKKAERGQLVYNEYCASCHQVIDRNDPYRLIASNLTNIAKVKTDPATAENSVQYTGYAGNFEYVYQSTDAGNLIIQKRAPVVQVLTAATKGAVATPDPDKGYFRRVVDWVYLIVKSVSENKIKASVKTGDYLPDTTANPYQSLLSYKGRPLNGIWATAPYLHNGSVPNLWSLLLPVEERPTEFCVGNREFDPVNVGFVTGGCDLNSPDDKNRFLTSLKGNYNTGHEYGAREVKDASGKVIQDKLTDDERWDLIEYIKTL